MKVSRQDFLLISSCAVANDSVPEVVHKVKQVKGSVEMAGQA